MTRGSMDSKEIEQLRALAFASIPSVSRKAVPPSVKPKRVPSAENEEGEIISDEDVDSAEVNHIAILLWTFHRESPVLCS